MCTVLKSNVKYRKDALVLYSMQGVAEKYSKVDSCMSRGLKI